MLRSFLSHSIQRYYEADKGAPTGEIEPPTGTEPKKTEEKQFSQAELEAIVKDRLARAKRKADDEAEKAKTEAAQKALLEQGEFKTLAEQRASELATLSTQLEAAKSHEETANKYRKALQDRLAVDKKALPESIIAILDQLDEIKQMEWLSNPKNIEALKPAADTSTTRTLGTPPRNASDSKRKTDAPVRPSSDVDNLPRFTLG